MILAIASISACTYADADEWPDKECNDYSAYILSLIHISEPTRPY